MPPAIGRYLVCLRALSKSVSASPALGASLSGAREPHGADVVVAFFVDQVGLRRYVPQLAKLIGPDGSLWTAWPRRAAGHVSDITDNVPREVLLPLGLVDVKVAAIDQDWSGLKFVWRKELRASLRT